MIEKSKLINNIDNKLWRRFVGKCIMQGVKVGHKINDLIRNEVDEDENRKVRQSRTRSKN